MQRSIMRIGLAIFILSIFGLPGHVAAQDHPTFDWDEHIAPGALLHVVTVAGEVAVVASRDGTARVRGRIIEPRMGARGEADLRFEVVREGGNVTICAVGPSGTCTAEGARETDGGRSDRWRADFTVEIPSGVSLRAGSGNGPVRVDGATAAVRASSGNGSVSVGPGADDVTASSGNGRVEVREARGPVRASTGNGAVYVATDRGPVDASTGNGRIEAWIASLPSSGEMSFRSGNGTILLVLPDDFSGEVRGTTGNGRLESAFSSDPPGRRRAGSFASVIGDGAWRIQTSTGNGSVELRRHSEPGSSGIQR